MKLKLTNNIQNIIVIVLFVALIFVILGIFYNYKEGYTDSSDNDAPTCSDSLDNDDEQNMYDNWFLKTKMVPPICPTCPYYFPVDGTDHTHADKKSDASQNDIKKVDTPVETPVERQIDQSGYQNDNLVNSQNDNSINQRLINKSDNSINNQNDNSVNQNIKQQQSQSADNKWNNLFGNNSITFGGNTTSGQPNYNTSQIGSLAGSGQTPYNNNSPVSTPAPAGKDSCPPCPACERCPEPAFECKKVPNYRSSSMDNYMPLPVLNDFSRF